MPVNVEDADAFEDLMNAVTDTLVRVHRHQFEKALDTFWKRLGNLPLVHNIVDVAGADLDASLRTLLVNLYNDASERWIHLTLRVIENQSEKASIVSLTRKGLADDAFNAMADYIQREALDKASTINRSVKDEARRLIARGIRDGKTLDQIADELASNRRLISRRRLRQIHRSPRQQAETIVRTEVLRAQTRATVEAINASPIVITRKQWMTQADEKVRQAHAAIHRVRIKWDEEFIVGGERALWPRDDRLSAGNVINCRCYLISLEKGARGPRSRSAKPGEVARPF